MAAAKANPKFKYTLFMNGVFTEFATSIYFGVNQEKKEFTIYGRADSDLSMTAAAEYVLPKVIELWVVTELY